MQREPIVIPGKPDKDRLQKEISTHSLVHFTELAPLRN